jgi:hypothetical protein
VDAVEHRDARASLARMPFIGRDVELGRLVAHLDAATRGRGGLVLVHGEPGIGKTRVAEALAETASARGAQVLYGHCRDGDPIAPAGPFAEAVAGALRGLVDRDRLLARLGAAAPVLARLVRDPDLLRRAAMEPPSLRTDEHRELLLDSVAQLLRELARRTTVVLVLEDLHWADAGTLAILDRVARVARTSALLVVATHREGRLDLPADVEEALLALQHAAGADRLALGGLATSAVERLAQLLLEERASPSLVAEAARATEGNPLFLQEWLRHVLEQRKDSPVSTPPPADGVPEGIRRMVLRRIERLPEDCRRLLRLAAVFGEQFTFAILLPVLELDEQRALAALDDALAAQLLRPAAEIDAYAFTHAMVREALYTSASPSRRLRLHRQIAIALERAPGGRSGERGIAIAYHYRRSAALPGAERGVAHALAGADDAAQAGAQDDVVRALRLALELLPRGDARRPRLLARLALSLVATLRFEQAVETAAEAASLLQTTDGDAAAADHLAEAAVDLSFAGCWRGAADLAQRGLRLARARRDATWVWLAIFDVLRRQAEAPDCPGLVVEAPECREIRAVADGLAFTIEQRTMLTVLGFSSFAERGAALPDREILDLAFSGPFRPCAALWQAGAAQQEQAGQIRTAAQWWAHVARLEIACGELAAAEVAHERAVGLAARTRTPSPLALLLAAVETEKALLAGEGEGRAATLVEEILAEPALELRLFAILAAVRSVGAVLHARAGDESRSRAHLEAVVRALAVCSPYAYHYAHVACDAAEAAWVLGDARFAPAIEAALREKALRSAHHYPLRDVHLALARSCALQGRLREAIEWFGAARRATDELGARPTRAMVDFDEALAHLRLGGDAAAARAAPLLAAAREQFEALGMSGWRTRCDALATRGGSLAGRAHEAVAIRRDGAHWLLSHAGLTVRMRTSLGLRYLAHLVAHPGEEIHVRELVAAAHPSASAMAGAAPGGRGGGCETPGEIVDAGARSAYRRALTDLRDELALAEAHHDLGRIASLNAQIDALTRQLAQALGLGGRVRAFASTSERMRQAVTKRVKAALRQIASAHPALGRHLAERVRTGSFCSYREPAEHEPARPR